MEYWEFLLQKEGDRSWLSLKKPSLEILEGRYRVVAHSNRPNTAVEIRITHDSTEEVPPRRRSQKRSRRTNAQGLMVVIPFTYFKPGIWDLRCSGDIMSDFLGNTWQQTIKFQVLPQAAETSTDSESAEQDISPEIFHPHSAEMPETSLPPTEAESQRWKAASMPVSDLMEHSLQMVDEILHEVVDPLWQAFEPIPAAPPQRLFTLDSELPREELPEFHSAIDSPDIATDITQPQVEATPETFLRLILDQENFVASRGEPIIFSGEVEVLDTSSSHNFVQGGTLRVEMRDPQNSKILVDVEQPLPEQVSSFAFRCNLELPEECKTRLILGEVTLIDETQTVLATQSFTVTADLEDLLGAIANDREAENLLNPPLGSLLAETPPLDSSFLDLVQQPKENQSLRLEPLPSQPLPPQITRSDPAKEAALKAPKLPAIASDTDATDSEGKTSVTPPPPPLGSLPPKIYRPDPANPVNKTLKLPLISGSAPVTEVQEAIIDSSSREIEPPTEENTALEQAPSDVEQLVDNLLNNLADSWQRPEIASAEDDSEDADTTANEDVAVEEPSDTPESENPAEDSDPTSTVDTAFATLKLKDRFLSRLNDLANDEELAQLLQPEEELPATEPELTESLSAPDVTQEDSEITGVVDGTETAAIQQSSETDSEASPESMSTDWELVAQLLDQQPPLPEFDEEDAAISSDAPSNSQLAAESPLTITQNHTNTFSTRNSGGNWADQEIVVDDDPFEEPLGRSDRISPFPPSHYPQPQASALDEEPVPAPELVLPEGELIAGQLLLLRVKLNSELSRIYVKLWIHDRQTRSLLDGPRWLVDFSPNAFGVLETMTQLTVPFGSMSIRFEAVTVDTYTQRESHKVTLDRTVIPPDLPNWSLDEFGD